MRSAGLVAGLAAGSVVLTLVGAGPAGAGPATSGASRPVGASGADQQVGRWTVAPAGPGSYRLTWHSPTVVPTTDAQAQVRHGGSVVPAAVGADGRTVSVLVSSATAPDPSTYDVVLGSRILDRRGTPAPGERRGTTDRTPARTPTPGAQLTDPGLPGTHAITSTDYTLAPVKLPGIGQLSEMVGHVVAPVDATDASPLVLFLHGRHEPCYVPHETSRPAPFVEGARVWACPAGQLPVPSYLGYTYVQRLLASQGYVTVSISADAINALDFRDFDGGAAARATLVRDHLRAWAGFVGDGSQRADLSNVVLVGHSRGGEGVNRASLDLPTDEGYHVTGQILIGPTDFAFQAAPATPTVTLLPYCDGDVADLQGQNFTDDGRDITHDPTTDLAFHSSVMVMGADHNFFNSEWTPGISVAPSFDDWGGRPDRACGSATPSRLSAGEQRKVGRTYIAGAVHLFADGDTSVLPMFDGSPVSVPSAGNADVRSHAIGGGLVTVRPGIEGSVSADATAAVRLCTGVSDSGDAASCQPRVNSIRAPHWPSLFFAGVPHRQFLEVGWTATGQQGGLDLAQPLDLSTASRLDLRTIVDPHGGPVRLGVTLTDADGQTAVVNAVGGGTLAPLPAGGFSLSKRWGQDLQAPLAGVTGVDLTRISRIGVVSQNASGRVFLVDLSATPAAGISPSPTSPTPLFSIDSVRQQEGDGTDRVTVDVPWHVTGDLEQDAVVTILRGTPFGFGGSGGLQTLTVPAHATDGVLHVSYRPNDLDDFGNRLLGLTAYPVSGLETDQYVGGATIIDDDPTPALQVRTAARRITAGDRATWTLTLDEPVRYTAFALARPVKAVAGPQLRVGDLPRRFRERWLGDGFALSTPLYRTPVRFFVEIRQGRLSGSFSIPTRRGLGVTRSVSLRFRSPHFGLLHTVRTVRVAPPR